MLFESIYTDTYNCKTIFSKMDIQDATGHNIYRILTLNNTLIE